MVNRLYHLSHLVWVPPSCTSDLEADLWCAGLVHKAQTRPLTISFSAFPFLKTEGHRDALTSLPAALYLQPLCFVVVMEEREAVTNPFFSSPTLFFYLLPLHPSSSFHTFTAVCSSLLPIPLHLSVSLFLSPHTPALSFSLYILSFLPSSLPLYQHLTIPLIIICVIPPPSLPLISQSQHFFCRALLINESQGEMIHGGSIQGQSILD